MSEFQTSGIDSLDQPGRSFQETGVHMGLERSGCTDPDPDPEPDIEAGAACSPLCAALLEATVDRGSLAVGLEEALGAEAGAGACAPTALAWGTAPAGVAFTTSAECCPDEVLTQALNAANTLKINKSPTIDFSSRYI